MQLEYRVKMMVPLRSNQTTKGRLMAGARSLWRANGMKEKHFGKPIIAIANSFTQLVPGHAHLHEIGQYIKIEIESLGYFSAEFNTIAIDDGIAMGHPGMLYSLPSRQLIADSIEYMCNAHMVDALVCIPNCDKIVPGMLMAAMRLNIPTIFVSGGPMEAGRIEDKKYDLVDIMVMAGDQSVPDSVVREVEGIACPTCGCCSGMFTANSMNCLTEAIGLALPGQGTILATHVQRKKLFTDSAKCLVEAIEQYYGHGDESVLPRSIASREAFMNAMTLDIAMGGSTNTVLHLLAAAQSAGVNFTLNDINMLSRKVPCICKVSPNSRYHLEDVNRAGGVMGILAELDRGGLIDTSVPRIDAASLKDALDQYGISSKTLSSDAVAKYTAAPGGYRNFVLGSQDNHFKQLDQDREEGCIRSVNNAYYKDGGLAVLFGNVAENGCIVKTAGVLDSLFEFNGTAKVFDSEDTACKALLEGKISSGNIVIIRYEGPKGGPGMQEMLYPTSYIKSMHLETSCALITDGRFSGGSSGLSIGHVSPEAAAGGAIGLIMDNDRIEINIHDRKIHLCISDEELSDRRRIENSKGHNAFKPNRKRHVSEPLLAYAWFAGSADKGAIRVIPKAENAFYSAKVNSTTNPSA